MGILIIIGKIFLSFFLIGMIMAGVFKASNRGRKPNNHPAAEWITGCIGFLGGIAGLYYLWF